MDGDCNKQHAVLPKDYVDLQTSKGRDVIHPVQRVISACDLGKDLGALCLLTMFVPRSAPLLSSGRMADWPWAGSEPSASR
ncbi:uncharacterized protein [Aegilops tauschii subsp. strangulata]|uniref:uncharacterized protein isoform X2 n=1 Tax=Aegilops tauschii subsp. strangulata TaxID=200361 RepID=UPI003CC8489F